MERITKEELEQLKREVPVWRLAQQRRGLALESSGGNLVGRCPFHDGPEDERSLIVRPSTNTWECRGPCKTRGSVIDWVMTSEKVGLRGAVEVLRNELDEMRDEAEQEAEADLPDHLSPLSPAEEAAARAPELRVPPPAPMTAAPAGEADELLVEQDDRRYRIRGLGRNKGTEQLRVTIQARRGEAFFVDSLDLYQARQRSGYERQAAVDLGVREE
ncbi:MAG: CHC2 zinc finger domain-containing protein, partial [Chloroflexota bacterium]